MLETTIRWIAYVGGWLLVIGPLFQSRVELEAERHELADIRETLRDTTIPRKVSRWWWLVPPVAFVLTRRRQDEQVDVLRATLTNAQLDALGRFFAVARGWMIVASGALLIAVKESYELAHRHHWGAAGFWVLVVIGVAITLGLISAGPTGRRRRHRR